MFHFRRITPILFGIPPLKAQKDYVLKIWGHDPPGCDMNKINKQNYLLQRSFVKSNLIYPKFSAYR